MPVSKGFTDFVVEQLEGCGMISTKRMFGGVGIYCGETFFAIIDNDVLYLKVDETNRPDFERAGSGPFRPYGDDSEVMQYYNVPVSILEDSGELTEWGRKAMAVAERKKAQKKKPKAAKAPERRGSRRG
jgi:DNA transformation protein and related proteins